MKNIFVVISGLDATGKTTCAQLLAKMIGGVYYKSPPEVFREIKEKIHAAEDPDSRFLFFVSANCYASKDIRKLLEKSPVVCDRYLADTFAYHMAFGADKKLVSRMRLNQKLVKPDVNFILEANDDVISERLEKRNDPSIMSFWSPKKIRVRRKIRANYRDFPRKTINTSRMSPEEVCMKMLRIINSFQSKKIEQIEE